MAELKTKKTAASVADFLATVDAERREDCRTIVTMMQKAAGAKPKMWGTSIVGFGDHRYKGASGESDWFLIGFSPRKHDLTLYLLGGLERHRDALAKLGKHKTGKGCLYIKRLADVDVDVLRSMVDECVNHLRSK